jgi:hypothetical protein
VLMAPLNLALEGDVVHRCCAAAVQGSTRAPLPEGLTGRS